MPESELKAVTELLSKLSVAKTADEAKGTAQEIATLLSSDIVTSGNSIAPVFESLKKQLADKKKAEVRQNAAEAIATIAKHAELSSAVEAALVQIFPSILSVS